MFFVAVIPLLLLPLIVYWLPESIGFLIRQGRTRQGSRAAQSVVARCTRIEAEDAAGDQPTAKAKALRWWSCSAMAWRCARR